MDKLEAWTIAQSLIEPIVETHGLKPVTSGAQIFSTPAVESTPVEQHIDQIIRVAEWFRE